MNPVRGVFIALAVASAIPAFAQSDVRPLATDRPDRTESPYTVPRGYVQIESDLYSVGRINGNHERVTTADVFTLNAKYGLTRSIDFQFTFIPWEDVNVEVAGQPDDDDSGTGHAGVRLKFNLAGNDDGGIAFALLPFASVPTRGNSTFDFVTWGMFAPLSFPIGENAAFSTMAGFTRVDNDDYWGSVSGSFGTAIVGNLSGFLELYVSRDSFDNDAIDDTTLDAGVTYIVRDNWQFDAGVYRGLAEDTEDWRVFVGASTRFPVR